MGFVLRFITILLLFGFAYVSLKRWLFPKRPAPPPGAAPPEAMPNLPPADDLVKCPRCGVYGIAGQSCSTPGCVAVEHEAPKA